MKKKSILWLLLAALMALPTVALAQEEVTVADGTSTNQYIPVYGSFIDAAQHNQIVYPASMLSEMEGSDISSLTFYLQSTPENTWAGAQYTVSLGTVENPTVSSSSFISAELTEVWSGEPLHSNNMLVIEFEEPYNYDGGDLLVDITSTNQYNIVTTYASGYFLGVTTTGNSSLYSYTSSGTPSYPSGTYSFIPKTTFEVTIGGDICRKPKGLAVVPSTNSIALSWVDTNNTGATYSLFVAHGTDTTFVTGISGNSYTFSGLDANTQYTLGVKAVCSATSESKYATISARTDCDALTIPWTDGFESYEINGFPDCWTLISGSTYSSYYGSTTYPYTYDYSLFGNKSLYFYNYNSSDTCFVRTQQLPIEANNMHISFWLRNSYAVQVGLITDAADLSTFTVLRTIPSSDGYWMPYDIYTDTVANLDATSGVYLAFRFLESYNSGYLDEVRVDEVSDCRRPLDGQVADVSYNSASCHWTIDEASSASAYDVLVTNLFTTNPDEDSLSILFEAIDDTATVLTGLRPHTEYNVWVRAVCGTGAVSDWQFIGDFETDYSCYTLENLTVNSVSFTSADISWSYVGAGRGLEELGVHFVLRDSTGAIVREWNMDKEDGTQTFITGLTSSANYTLSVSTLCDPDTASAVSVSFSTSGCGEVAGGNASTNYIPIMGNYNYGYTQALYPASAASSMGSISGLSYNVTSASSSVPQRTVKVWMAQSDRTTLSTSDYVDTSDMTLVYNGNLNVGNVGWTTINFSTPFTVSTSGGSNLVVAVLNTTGSYNSVTFSGHAGVGVYGYQDGTSAAGSTVINSYDYRNAVTTVADIRFVGDCDLTCYSPNLRVQEVGVNSVDLQWARGLDEGSWAVQYRADTSNVWLAVDAASDTLATVSGLDARTRYHFRVGSLCGNDTMWSNIAATYTLCETLTELPFTDGFETYPTDIDPLCWQVYNYKDTYTGTSTTSHFVTSSGHTSSRSYYTYVYGVNYLVSPLMPQGTDMSTLEVSWWASVSNYARYEVGYMTDPADPATFRLLGSFAGNNNAWTEYTVYGDTTTLSEPAYVAYRFYADNGYGCYVDDITIRVATCKRPSQVHTTALTDTTATLAWNGMDGATYEYCLTTTNAQPADSVELHTASDATCTVEGLQANTEYYFWARSICGDETTPWNTTYSFRTACGTLNAPLEENFDNWTSSQFDVCWKRYTGTYSETPTLTPVAVDWTGITRFSTETSYNPFTGRALAVNVYSGYKVWAAMPTIHVESPVVLSFDLALRAYYSYSAASNINSNTEFRVVASTDGGTTWTTLASWGSGNSYTYAYNALTSSGTNVSVPVNYTDQDVLIAFYSGSGGSGEDNTLWIDNLKVESAACMRPVNVMINRQAESATFSWLDLSTDNEDGYVLLINTENSTTGATTYTTTDTFFTVSGLTPVTTYYYFLRSACTETITNSSWASGSFRTACTELVMPLDDDFENYTSGYGAFPDCWERLATNTYSGYNAPYVYNYGGARGKVLYFYGYSYSYGYGSNSASDMGMIAVTPFIPHALNNLEISLGVYSDDDDEPIKMYVGTNPNDTSTWEFVANLPQGSFQSFEVSTDELTTADSGYVIFTGVTGSSIYTYGYIDDVFITVANPCRRPASVTASNITPYTADLTWPEIEGANGYRVKYSQQNNILTADSLADVNSNEVTLSGLQNGTRYYVWVQTLCADGISDPRGTNFETQISCYPIYNLRRTGLTATAASFMWDIDERGNEAQSVYVTLKDLTDSTETSTAAMGMGYHIFDGLTVNHSYTATFRTVCDVDSAAGVSISFTTVDAGDECVVLDEGTSTTYIAPVYTYYYGYSYTQTIYPASSVSGLDSITGIAYNVTTTQSQPITVSVYMGHTTNTAFAYYGNFEPSSNLTLVASNLTLDLSQEGWVNLNFTTPFAYNGSSNLVVAIVRNDGTGTSYSYAYFAAEYNSGEYGSIYAYSSYAPIDITNTSSLDPYGTSYRPNIKFFGNCGGSDGCTKPVTAVADVDTSSVSLAWLGGSGSNYVLQYRKSSDTVWFNGTTSATSPATISGLESGTYYQVRVGGICGNDTVFSASLTTLTDCAPLHIPFHFTQADMQAAYSAGFSPCWSWESFTRSYSGSTYYVYTYSSSSWFALPEIAEPINTTQLRTLVATTYGGMQMRVGVMEADGSITWVETVDVPTTASSTSGVEQIVYLDGYTGTGNRIVVGGTNSNYLYFLDFHVEALESCRHISNLSVVDIEETTANISWTGATGQTQWAVYVNGALKGTTTTASYTITGLAAATNYEVSVSAVCGAGDTSSAMSVSFRTGCSNSVSLPWSDDFESHDASSAPSCWNILQGYTNYSTEYPYVSSSSYSTHGGSKYLYGFSYDNLLFSTPMFAAAGNTISGSVWVRGYDYDYDYGYGYDYYDIQVEIGLMTNVNDESTFTVILDTMINDDWTELTFSAANSGVTANAAVAFRVHCGAIGNYGGYIYIDDLTIDGTNTPGPGPNPEPEPDECNAPVAGTVSTTHNTATFNWTGTAPRYEVAIVEGSNFGGATVESVVNGTEYTFEGLTPNTTYTVGVRSACADGTRSEWVTRQATTTQVGIDAVDALGMVLYPNPATNMVTVEADNAIDAQVSIIDQSGRVAGTWTMEGTSLSIDLSGMARGAYYVRLTTADNTAVRKLIVQ